jgi:hypothetical protein
MGEQRCRKRGFDNDDPFTLISIQYIIEHGLEPTSTAARYGHG